MQWIPRKTTFSTMLYNNLRKLKLMINIDYDSNVKMCGYLAIVFVNIVLLISQTVSIAESFGDIVKTSSSLATYGLKLQVTYKLFFLYWKKGSIIKMHKWLDKYFWDTNIAGKATEEYLNKSYEMFLLFIGSHSSMIFLVYTWFCCFPLVIYPPEIRTLPLQLSLPFDSNPSPLHEFLYLVLIASGTGNILIIIGFDFLFLYFCQHLIVQFKLLQNVLPDFANAPNNLNDVDVLRSDEIQETFVKRLNSYIRHHAMLLEFGTEIKSFASIAITIQVIVTMLSLITLGFGITKGDLNFTHLQMMLLFNCMLVEITLYCVYGSELEHESEAVCQAVCESNWYLLRPRFRKNILFLQMNAQKEIQISAAGTVIINNITLIQILRSIFSAITLLQTLDQD